MKRHFTEENMQIESKCMKGCSTALATREMQIKTRKSYHCTTITSTKIKHNDDT